MGANVGHPMGWQGFGVGASSAFAESQSQPTLAYTASTSTQKCDYCDCYFEDEFDSTTEEEDNDQDRTQCLFQLIDLCKEVINAEEAGRLDPEGSYEIYAVGRKIWRNAAGRMPRHHMRFSRCNRKNGYGKMLPGQRWPLR